MDPEYTIKFFFDINYQKDEHLKSVQILIFILSHDQKTSIDYM